MSTKKANGPGSTPAITSTSLRSRVTETLATRESAELVLGFSGPVGSGLDQVVSQAEEYLKEVGYKTIVIKLSKFIVNLSEKHGSIDIDLPQNNRNQRYEKLQTAGNELRNLYGNGILSEVVVSRIATHRKKTQPQGVSAQEAIPPKTAYLIDQLKHPEEVDLLRTVYGNLFYLVGVLASEDQRKQRLVGEGLTEPEASQIMERDRREDIGHGQQLEKTLELSDLFIRNSHSNRTIIQNQITRFIELVHGRNGITPTQHEYAMYIAYAAGLRSACLSRQVGAAITDESGTVLATGCNDVPRPHGGLYSESDGSKDNRCVNIEGGKCFNDDHKRLLTEEIEQILADANIKPEEAKALALTIKKSTRLKDLIEFSRSVHAEMDAITTAARKGNVSVAKGYLYSTTFPCHNCARHIIAAGIRKVFYIEPYEKSLAPTLHRDAIILDPDDESEEMERVQFLHFEGVSPRQYQRFFLPTGPRKKDGKALFEPTANARKVSAQYLDDYRQFELKVVQHLHDRGVDADIMS